MFQQLDLFGNVQPAPPEKEVKESGSQRSDVGGQKVEEGVEIQKASQKLTAKGAEDAERNVKDDEETKEGGLKSEDEGEKTNEGLEMWSPAENLTAKGAKDSERNAKEIGEALQETENRIQETGDTSQEAEEGGQETEGKVETVVETAEPEMENNEVVAEIEPMVLVVAETEVGEVEPVVSDDPGADEEKKVEDSVAVSTSKQPDTIPVNKPAAAKRGRKPGRASTADSEGGDVPEDEVLFQKQYYAISEVAGWFRVNASLIRFWENEFDILKPRKNRKGDRLFRPEDVKNLQLIHHLLRDRKYTIEGAKEYLKVHQKKADMEMQLVQALQRVKSFLLDLKVNLEE